MSRIQAHQKNVRESIFQYEQHGWPEGSETDIQSCAIRFGGCRQFLLRSLLSCLLLVYFAVKYTDTALKPTE